ncbi:MAG: type II toxin-antitoxin system VapC family toxin [Herminiimonas sp.]|nr:type II toxin-antitoxin system VapC family toxin [Herminiimonas sp.]
MSVTVRPLRAGTKPCTFVHNLDSRAVIVSATEVYVSSASIWEAAIKVGIGKLDVDLDELAAEIKRSGFKELPITARHAAMVKNLPEVHRDPFDRILVAQALAEPLRFVTCVGILKGYPALADVI